MRDCDADGHVLVEDDQDECPSCGRELEHGDRIGLRVTIRRRHLGELVNPADRASVSEWGHAGLEGSA